MFSIPIDIRASWELFDEKFFVLFFGQKTLDSLKPKLFTGKGSVLSNLVTQIFLSFEIVNNILTSKVNVSGSLVQHNVSIS